MIETQNKNRSIQTYQYVSAKSLADALPGLRRTEELKQTPAEERREVSLS